MGQYATKEGTFAYLKQFPKYAKDFYRFNGDFFTSSLGLGSFRKEPYREENYTVNYKDAVKMAILNGINFIDTAINYRYQVSEQEIGEAIAELIAEGKVSREQLIITSKAGFIPLQFPFPENPYEWIDENILTPALATKDEVVIDQHCMSPKFLQWSVEQSLKNLQIETLDIFMLHNPETQLGFVERSIVMQRIKEAFETMETMVKDGKIQKYGVAAWNAFLYEADHKEYISISDLVDIAVEVGGKDHHFKYVQSPFNLGKPHAYVYPNQEGPDGKYYTLMQILKGYGINYIASSSLLQMNLFKKKFVPKLGAALYTSELNDVASALQFARSGNTLTALFGAVDPQHVEDNLVVAYLPNVSDDVMKTLV